MEISPLALNHEILDFISAYQYQLFPVRPTMHYRILEQYQKTIHSCQRFPISKHYCQANIGGYSYESLLMPEIVCYMIQTPIDVDINSVSHIRPRVRRTGYIGCICNVMPT